MARGETLRDTDDPTQRVPMDWPTLLFIAFFVLVGGFIAFSWWSRWRKLASLPTVNRMTDPGSAFTTLLSNTGAAPQPGVLRELVEMHSHQGLDHNQEILVNYLLLHEIGHVKCNGYADERMPFFALSTLRGLGWRAEELGFGPDDPRALIVRGGR